MKSFLLAVLSIVMLQGCNVRSGSGNIEQQNRNVSSFNTVKASSGIKVFVKQGSHKVRVEADDNILEDVVTEVSGGNLNIKFRNGVSIKNADVVVYVETPELTGVYASSGADVEVQETLHADKTLHFQASSSGSIIAMVDAPSVNLDASSSGDIDIKGRTRQMDAQASSSGSIKAAELLSESTRAQASSAGSIDVHASVSLNAQASSGASINYRGNPTVSKQESSGGSIEKH